MTVEWTMIDGVWRLGMYAMYSIPAGTYTGGETDDGVECPPYPEGDEYEINTVGTTGHGCIDSFRTLAAASRWVEHLVYGGDIRVARRDMDRLEKSGVGFKVDWSKEGF